LVIFVKEFLTLFSLTIFSIKKQKIELHYFIKIKIYILSKTLFVDLALTRVFLVSAA